MRRKQTLTHFPCVFLSSTLSEASEFLTDAAGDEDAEGALSMVRAGRRSIEMATVPGLAFCPNKTTATEVSIPGSVSFRSALSILPPALACVLGLEFGAAGDKVANLLM